MALALFLTILFSRLQSVPAMPSDVAGYFSLIQAGTLLRDSVALRESLRESVPAPIRIQNALKTPEAQEAGRILRDALSRPLRVPVASEIADPKERQKILVESGEFRPFRALALLCQAEHADRIWNRTPGDPLEPLQNGLRLRDITQTQGVSGWRTSLVLQRAMTDPLLSSVRNAKTPAECERDFAFLKQVADAPPSLVGVLESERQRCRETLEILRQKPELASYLFANLSEGDALALKKRLTSSPEKRDAMLQETFVQMERLFDSLLTGLRHAPQERPPISEPNTRALGGKLLLALFPDYKTLLSENDAESLRLHLTGLHLLLQKRFLEQGRYPETLAEVTPPEGWTKHTKTGALVYYKGSENAYELLPEPPKPKKTGKRR